MTPEEAMIVIRDVEAYVKQQNKTRWCPHDPSPKQTVFLALICLEALYGGAAGGGKSDAILMGALQYVDRPNYSALLLRKTYADLSLPGALMDRAAEWLRPTAAQWSDKEKRWTFPSGATITFGYLETEKDKYRYQSAEFQYIGFDELTQFAESQYVYLLSRLRRLAGDTTPIRARGASNPGGIGHAWVKSRFLDSKTRRGDFVPARLADNAHIDQAEYTKTLSELDETTRRQMLDGEWVQDVGGLIYHYSPDKNSTGELPALPDRSAKWSHIWGVDFGSSERTPSTAFGVMAYSPLSPNVYLLESSKHAGITVSDVAERFRADEARYGSFDHVLGDQGGLGSGYLLELQQRHNIPIVGVEKKNKLGYRKLLNDDLNSGKLLIVASTNDEWIEEANTLSWNEKGTDAQSGQADHATDCVLYLWREAKHWAYREPEKIKTDEQKIHELWANVQAKIEQRKAQRPVRIGRA